MIDLWRENPRAALSVIDSYLEGQPARRQEKGDAGSRGDAPARCAGPRPRARPSTPIFLDYASSFVGWTPEQQKGFRAGQAAFKGNRQALAGQDLEGRCGGNECVRLARPWATGGGPR
jgi:hypothetical protein